MYDVLFTNADILTLSGAALHGALAVQNGHIAAIGEVRGEARRRIDCTNKLLVPGLVNTHAHTAMCVMRGYADDYTLSDWLFKKVFPVEARLTEREVLAGARLGFCEMLSCGVTSISDMYYDQPAVAELALEAGLRVNLCNAVVALGEFDAQTDRGMRETRTLAEKYHGAGNGRIRADVSIHAEYTSGPEVWKQVTALGREYGLGMQVHLSETRKEQEEGIARRGATPARALYEAGVFSLPTTAAHGVWLTEEDAALLAQEGVSVAHCPVSNLKLASGRAPLMRLLRAGVNVSLGTDGCCSNNTHDLFEEMKLAALLAKEAEGDPACLPAVEALKLATVNGAKAQGREGQIGRLEAGMEADLILLDMRTPTTWPLYDPVSAAVYSATGRNVCLTMVQGRILYENGRFTTLDIEEAYREAERARDLIRDFSR